MPNFVARRLTLTAAAAGGFAGLSQLGGRLPKARHLEQLMDRGLCGFSCFGKQPLAGMAASSSYDHAQSLFRIYERGYAPPQWSLDLLKTKPERFAQLAAEVTVYYRDGDTEKDVRHIAECREPVNIAMGRYYDRKALQATFGYEVGGYALSSTKTGLMPNIAIYCRTPMRQRDDEAEVHVINVIGYAFDDAQQPDFQYFLPCKEGDAKWTELVGRFSQMWRYIFECAVDKKLSRIYLADVGGGAFSGGLNKRGPGYAKLKEASLGPLLREFEQLEVKPLPMIPDFIFSREGQAALASSLFVNAWDPWSMVGNGNEQDHSLDGFFGRCTAMALLCWPVTNPAMQYKAVRSTW